MVRRVSSSIFVGRVAERVLLESALDAAERGEPGLILVGGEAGIGKTRLIGELAALAGTRGALVLRGRCVEARAIGLPYAPFVEILRGLRPGDDGRAAGALNDRSPELAPLVPEMDREPEPDGQLPNAEDRLRLFHAVLDQFRRAANERSLLVLVEDLHWADPSSIDLLRFLAGELEAERLLIIATLRTDEPARLHPLGPDLSELTRLPHVARIELSALTEPEVADQLTGISGRRPAADVVERVFARSDGNPFFVEELAGRDADQLPPALRDVLAVRINSLSVNARRLVLVAAAIGRETSQELLAEVSGLPSQQLLESLHEAVDHHVLVPSGSTPIPGFTFRHALIRELAYGDLLPSERLALHAAIAATIRSRGGSPGELAHHAILANDRSTALVASVEAADQAIGALAFAEALSHLERALALWADVSTPEGLAGRDPASLATLAARCAGALGQWRRAADLGRMALAHLDPAQRRDERIAALLEQARWELLADDERARAAAVLEAADLVRTDPPGVPRARVLTELAHLASHDGRPDDAARLAKEALEMSRAIGNRAEEARALVRLAEALGALMQAQAAEEMLAEAERIALEGNAPYDDFVGYLVFRRADLALGTGAFGRAIEIADSGIARAARAGRSGERSGFLRAIKVASLVALGRWDEAETLVDEASQDEAVVTARLAAWSFVPALVRQGRIAEAAESVRSTDFGYVTPHEGSFILETRLRVADGQGRWDDARAAAQEAIGLFVSRAGMHEILPILEESVRIEADRGVAARRRRRTAEEREARRVGTERLHLLRSAAEVAIRPGGDAPLTEAILAQAEAEGCRLEGASDAGRWEEAARRRAALGQRWETAYARFRQAEAMLSAGAGRSAAAPLLRDAQQLAFALGARPLVEQIEALARRGRIRLAMAAAARPARRATTVEGVVVTLTSRESEVLSLVAAGHTNREIGETLFISTKTASVHITNAMDKLGALSRYDAAASAARLGLLDASPGDRPV